MKRMTAFRCGGRMSQKVWTIEQKPFVAVKSSSLLRHTKVFQLIFRGSVIRRLYWGPHFVYKVTHFPNFRDLIYPSALGCWRTTSWVMIHKKISGWKTESCHVIMSEKTFIINRIFFTTVPKQLPIVSFCGSIFSLPWGLVLHLCRLRFVF